MKKRRVPSRAVLTALLALVLVISVAGATIAWLASRTQPIVNTFALGVVTVDIPEDFDYTVKSDVQIENPEKGPDGRKSVPAYVRVALIPTWTRDAVGKEPVGEPASLSDLEITWGKMDDWVIGSDGYYYYKRILHPGETTSVLIETAVVNQKARGYENGYHMNVQVIADGIQAYPSTAVEGVWPVRVGASGELEVVS